MSRREARCRDETNEAVLPAYRTYVQRGYRLPRLCGQQHEVFGHETEIVGAFGNEKLMVDNKPLVKDAIVVIDRIDIVDGVGVIVGGASGGGNACDSSPFVVSFPKGEPAKVDGPLEQCGMGRIEIKGNRIEIVDTPLPNIQGHLHYWTAGTGFQDGGIIDYKPEAASGWDRLRRHDLAFPLDLYKNKEISLSIKELTKSDDETFTSGLIGPSRGEFEGDLYVGSGCVPHNCNWAGSFIVADRINKKVFLAWKADGKPFVVRPPVGTWPGQLRIRLKQWTQKFD